MRALRSGDRHFVLIYDDGDDVVSLLLAFARREGIAAASLQAIGAFRSVRLAFFDLVRKEYLPIEVPDQVEVVSLLGNLARFGEDLRCHIHAVVGYPDGRTLGGHLLEAKVRPTLELFLTVLPGGLQREVDEATGLPLLAGGEPVQP